MWQKRLMVVCLLLGMSAGCGPKVERPKVYKATGVVKLGGKPVADALVMFTPESGRPATAKTNSGGEFSLTTFNTNDGALAGTHTVTVKSTVAAEVVSNSPEELKKIADAAASVPLNYGDPKTSGLSNTVTAEGPNHFEIDLK